ncbi:MAG: hypothetical protein JXR70_02405 [Spirochaetales bacterium]|nr:hypothetical protein [Spirochaetales bacterium]
MIEFMDTTLRDGEQMRDVSYNAKEKLTITKMLLEDLKVSRVEITSARVSEGEQESLSQIIQWAKKHGYIDNIEILGFTDKNKSIDWLDQAGGKVINLLAKGSLRHCEIQLRKTPAEHFKDIMETIDYASSKGIACNIYLETWSNGMIESLDYVYQMIDTLKNSSIKRFMLPDTLGILDPVATYEHMSKLVQRYPDLHFDYHGHNDYGLATANTLAAVRAGAKGVHCTINGMGERTGNTSLDEVAVGIRDFLNMDIAINEKKLFSVSETVEAFSGKRIPFNKPVVGSNVFTQTAGIHADGDSKGDLYANRLLPERFNRKRHYALGKLSGRSNLDYNLKELGIELTADQKKQVLNRIIELGDKKAAITQDDLPYIISDVLEQSEHKLFSIDSLIVVTSKGVKSMATIKVRHREQTGEDYSEHEEIGKGDGGYDAIMDAVGKITSQLGYQLPQLVDYQITIPPGGKTDALVQCSITWRSSRTFVTKGVNPDQVLAAAEATEKMLNSLA